MPGRERIEPIHKRRLREQAAKAERQEREREWQRAVMAQQKQWERMANRANANLYAGANQMQNVFNAGLGASGAQQPNPYLDAAREAAMGYPPVSMRSAAPAPRGWLDQLRALWGRR